jgi:hypothetical protein
MASAAGRAFGFWAETGVVVMMVWLLLVVAASGKGACEGLNCNVSGRADKDQKTVS